MSAAPGPSSRFERGTVGHDAAWSLAYSGVVRVATVGLSIAVARLMGPEGAGSFGISLQVTALATMLATFNLPQGLAKHLAESNDPRRRRALVWASASLIVALGAAACASLWFLSGSLGASVYHDRTLAPVLAACGPLVLATATYLLVEGALQGVREFEQLARWGAMVSVLDLGFGLAATRWGVPVVITARAVIRALAVAWIALRWLLPRGSRHVLRTPGPVLPEPPEMIAMMAPLIGFAGPALLAAAIVLSAQTLLRVLLVRGSGLVAAGQFQAADSIAQGLLLVPTAAAAAFMRDVASRTQGGYSGLAGSLRRGLQSMSGYNLALCMALIGVVPWAIGGLFGARFESAKATLVILSGAYCLSGLAMLFGAALLGRGQVWAGVALNALWAAVALTAYRLAGAPYGAIGLAGALWIAYFIHLFVCIGALAPRWSVPVSELLPIVMVNVAFIVVASALALAPRVPAPLAAGGCALLGAVAFFRWGYPMIASAVRSRRSAADG